MIDPLIMRFKPVVDKLVIFARKYTFFEFISLHSLNNILVSVHVLCEYVGSVGSPFLLQIKSRYPYDQLNLQLFPVYW